MSLFWIICQFNTWYNLPGIRSLAIWSDPAGDTYKLIVQRGTGVQSSMSTTSCWSVPMSLDVLVLLSEITCNSTWRQLQFDNHRVTGSNCRCQLPCSRLQSQSSEHRSAKSKLQGIDGKIWVAHTAPGKWDNTAEQSVIIKRAENINGNARRTYMLILVEDFLCDSQTSWVAQLAHVLFW